MFDVIGEVFLRALTNSNHFGTRLEQATDMSGRPQWRLTRTGLQYGMVSIVLEGNSQGTLLFQYTFGQRGVLTHYADAHFTPRHGGGCASSEAGSVDIIMEISRFFLPDAFQGNEY